MRWMSLLEIWSNTVHIRRLCVMFIAHWVDIWCEIPDRMGFRYIFSHTQWRRPEMCAIWWEATLTQFHAISNRAQRDITRFWYRSVNTKWNAPEIRQYFAFEGFSFAIRFESKCWLFCFVLFTFSIPCNSIEWSSHREHSICYLEVIWLPLRSDC